MSDFRVAVVGLGSAGATLHLPALQGIAGVSVVGAMELDAERRARAAAKFGVPVFSDFQAMLTGASPDVVIVATPPDTHADYTLRSLAAGAHVVCEKPFVSSLQEADQIIAAAATAKRQVALNHEFRHMPIFRALTDAAAPSEVVFAQVWQLMDLAPGVEAGWRGALRQRTLFEAGSHLIDFLMALFGEKPISVSATTSMCGVQEGDGDAVALVTLEFSRGRLAQIVQNRLCKSATHYFEVRAETRAASFRASFGGRARMTAGLLRSTRPHVRLEYGVSGLAWREVGANREVLASNPKHPEMLGTRYVLEKSLAAFRDGTAPPTTAQRGRDVIEVIAACYRSAATGQRLSLNAETEASVSALRMGASRPASQLVTS